LTRKTIPDITYQGSIQRGKGSRKAMPPIVDWVDFLGKKPALLGLFSLPEVFCGPQICQKCVGGRGSAPDPAEGTPTAQSPSLSAPSALSFCASPM